MFIFLSKYRRIQMIGGGIGTFSIGTHLTSPSVTSIQYFLFILLQFTVNIKCSYIVKLTISIQEQCSATREYAPNITLSFSAGIHYYFCAKDGRNSELKLKFLNI